MLDDVAVRLPSLAGRQQESWRAFIELTPRLGDHCLLVGGLLTGPPAHSDLAFG
jgi:hypothetical protein